MKNKILIFLIMCCFLLNIIELNAASLVNISSKSDIVNNLNKSVLINKDFLLDTDKFNCDENGNCLSVSGFNKIGLLSYSEFKKYGAFSYLYNKSPYFVLDGSSIEALNGHVLTDSDIAQVRPVVYLNNEVKLYGDGSKANPYRIEDYVEGKSWEVVPDDIENEEKTLTIPKDGFYRLEVWGAQGGYGYNHDNRGGYGSYSLGFAYLKKGDILYINVGKMGKNGVLKLDGEIKGGYNGGGTTFSNGSKYVGSGGGASSIALKSGLLSSLENDKDKILIVAGGGGAGAQDEDYKSIGGDAGGYVGNSGTSNYYKEYNGLGGSYNTGGLSPLSNSNGSFGQGGNAKEEGLGGGGGYFGGGASKYSSGSGGGSGYIAGVLDGHMYCFNCKTLISRGYTTKSNAENSCVSSLPVEDCAKLGDGYAKVTFVSEEYKETSTVIFKDIDVENEEEDQEQVVIVNEPYKELPIPLQEDDDNTFIGWSTEEFELIKEEADIYLTKNQTISLSSLNSGKYRIDLYGNLLSNAVISNINNTNVINQSIDVISDFHIVLFFEITNTTNISVPISLPNEASIDEYLVLKLKGLVTEDTIAEPGTILNPQFIKTQYNVTINTINSVISLNYKTVDSKSNAEFTIRANDGFDLKDSNISCTNDQEYSLYNNKFTVIKVTNDTVCTIFPKRLSYKLDVNPDNNSYGNNYNAGAHVESFDYRIVSSEGNLIDEKTNSQDLYLDIPFDSTVYITNVKYREGYHYKGVELKNTTTNTSLPLIKASGTEFTFKTNSVGAILLSINTEVNTYVANVEVTGGEASSSALNIEYGKSNTVTVTPDAGYYLDSAICDNGYTTNASSGLSATGVQNVTISNNSKASNANCTFTFKVRTFTVSVSATNGNVSSSSLNIEYGKSNTVTVTPDAGYYLDSAICDNGYTTNASSGVSATKIQNVTISNNSKTSNAACTFKFLPATYTLTFNDNGGSGGPGTQTGTYKENITISSIRPTRFGWNFKGWATKANGSVVYSANTSYSEIGNKTLYAVWGQDTVTQGQSKNTDSLYGGQIYYFKFIPTTTKSYHFISTSSSDTYGYLYDASGNQLQYNDDGGENFNFDVTYDLTANTTYYYGVKFYSSSSTGIIPVKIANTYNVTFIAENGRFSQTDTSLTTTTVSAVEGSSATAKAFSNYLQYTFDSVTGVNCSATNANTYWISKKSGTNIGSFSEWTSNWYDTIYNIKASNVTSNMTCKVKFSIAPTYNLTIKTTNGLYFTSSTEGSSGFGGEGGITSTVYSNQGLFIYVNTSSSSCSKFGSVVNSHNATCSITEDNYGNEAALIRDVKGSDAYCTFSC